MLGRVAETIGLLDTGRPNPCTISQTVERLLNRDRNWISPHHVCGYLFFLHPVPGFQDQAAGAVFAQGAHFVVLEPSEGLGRVIGALYVSGVENVAQFVAAEAVGAGIPCVEFRAQPRPPLLVPAERGALVAEVTGERRHGMAGVGQFKDAGDDEG